MPTTFEQASIEDLDDIDQLQQKLALFERKLDDLLKQKGMGRYYTRRALEKILSGKDKGRILLARDESLTVGFCLAEISKNKARFSEYKEKGYIGMLFVEEAYRHQGVGKKLLQQSVAWLKSIGLKDIRLLVFARNNDAVNLYKKSGFSERLIEMRYNG